MRLTNVGNVSRGFVLLSSITILLATVAATNLALIYLLFTIDHPGSDLVGFLPIMAIGVAPFLVTAVLIARVMFRAGRSASPIGWSGNYA